MLRFPTTFRTYAVPLNCLMVVHIVRREPSITGRNVLTLTVRVCPILLAAQPQPTLSAAAEPLPAAALTRTAQPKPTAAISSRRSAACGAPAATPSRCGS